MNIIQRAQEKREQLRSELARIEAFLGTAFELEQEFKEGRHAVDERSDAAKADAPMRDRAGSQRGAGSETLRKVAELLRERSVPMSTRELLPLVRAAGIEVGGKDPLATLSARISQKGVVATTNGKWWFINGQQASGAVPSGEEATDGSPAKAQSAASYFHFNQGERRDAAPLAR